MRRIEAPVESDEEWRAASPPARGRTHRRGSRSRSTGFSQNTALPARAARSMIAACVRGGVQIITAPTAGSASASSRFAVARAPYLAASASRRRDVEIDDPARAARSDGGDVRRVQRSDEAAADEAEVDHAALPGESMACIGGGATSKPASSAARFRLREAQSRIGQRMRLGGILLGLDDEPARVTARRRSAQHGGVIDRSRRRAQ